MTAGRVLFALALVVVAVVLLVVVRDPQSTIGRLFDHSSPASMPIIVDVENSARV